MAGKFLSLEEAARMLGKTVDEVNRLVDRKVLFPMRDGATLKFKLEEIERALADLADGSDGSDDLSLDLDLPAEGPAADEPLVLDDGLELDSIFEGQQPNPKSPSATGGLGSAAGTAGGLSLDDDLLGGGDLVLGPDLGQEAAESDDLQLEAIVGATSSPSLDGPGSGRLGGGSGIELGSGIDLAGGSGIGPAAGAGSGIALGSGVDLGSGVGLGSGPSLGSGASQGGRPKAPASGPLDSGVSLEVGGGLLDEPGSSAGSSGDDFELGGVTGTEEESASVVIASDSEAGESSFFGQTIGGQSSSSGFTEDSAIPSAGSSDLLAFPGTVVEEMAFSVWQVVGLICCSLLLLLGSFIAYDLVRTIGSPESTRMANPLLDGLAQLFGWRS
ncbi:MAG: hypothetical protein KGQ61_12750 [Planctomycetes bacterium]|nr:hypothetical protein [Planctomycetota bacterium]